MTNEFFGVGLDVGTMNLVSARRTEQAVETKRLRNAFLDIPMAHKKMLAMTGVSHFVRDEDLIIVGDVAYDMANMFRREVRRPLQSGLVSTGDMDALEILAKLIQQVLGPPKKPKEKCYFSVPAPPVDDLSKDIIYHTGMLSRIISDCGYDPVAGNEAMAIIYSECPGDQFSGLAVSYGCLTPETRIFTREGLVPISSVKEGDEVLTKTGDFGRVLKTWTKPHTGKTYHLDFYGNPEGVSLTGNHLVWVQREGVWSWIPAAEVRRGDVVGEPAIKGSGKTLVSALTEKVTNKNGKSPKRTVAWSMKMGRFLGYFLADGHLGPDDQHSIFVDFGPTEQSYVEDLQVLVSKNLRRSVSVVKHGNALRCQFSHKSMHAWLKRHCYDKNHAKRFPFNLEDVKQGLAEGLVVGLTRGDGWEIEDGIRFGNTSMSLVSAYHLLLGRLGINSTIAKRSRLDCRPFPDGHIPDSLLLKDEWIVGVNGAAGMYLKQLINSTHLVKRSPRIWRDGGVRCTKIREVVVSDYEGSVHDLTVEGDPSFCAPYITLHNSGMSNLALAVHTIEGMTFSVGRGGDSIDAGAAKAVGSTAARICSIKEQGLDLQNPKGREQEAIALYYRDLIEYTLRHIVEQFSKNKGSIVLPQPIPFVVSGGTSKATGFLEIFREIFEAKRKNFPIPISEVRAAQNPLDAVARGLLVQASQE